MVDNIKSKPGEEWKRIPDFPDYEASNYGRVKSFKRRQAQLLSPVSYNGYLRVCLRRNGKTHLQLVHRLVMAAFIGPCPDGMETCHNDSNPGNNHLDNLRYDTPTGNCEDLRDSTEIIAIRNLYAKGVLIHNIAEKFGISSFTVHSIGSGRSFPMIGGPKTDPRQRKSRYAQKLTDAQVAEILEKRALGRTLLSLAQEYNVTESHVSRLTRGLARKKITIVRS